MSNILIGTSGWVYKSWRGNFYPDNLKQKDELAFYSQEFNTVEINSSYYRLPTDKAYRQWLEVTPADFIFAEKTSRFLTHMKKLKDSEEPWERFITGAELLEDRLGPVLLQFPAKWKRNTERLREFFEVVNNHPSKNPLIAFEFRNETWQNKEVLKILETNNAAWCIGDSYKFTRMDEITADFSYIRYHGPEGEHPNYSKKYLKRESEKIKKLVKSGIDLFIYFNNDAEGFAIDNARTLKCYLDIG